MFSKLLPFFPVGYVPHTRWRFAVSYEMKTNGTWIYSASCFASVGSAQRFIVRFIFVFNRAIGNPQQPIRTTKTSFIWPRPNSLSGFTPYRRQGRVESQSVDQLRQIVPHSIPQDDGRLLQ